MEIINHFLTGEQVSQQLTPNIGGAFSSGLPDTLVMHYTGGGSAASSASHLCKKSAKASAHLVIGRDGKIFQLAPFDVITWHAGRSSWQGRTGLNQYSIGIELDNAGELSDNQNGKYLSWFNKAYSGDEVFHGVHRNRGEASFWHTYTEQQIETAFYICQLICEHYNIKYVVGHEEIAPKRKSDPGPAFPLDRMRELILTANRHSELAEEPDSDAIKPVEGLAVVNASKLNVRTGPGADFALVGSPLVNGVLVKTLRTQGAWTEVEIPLRAWVSSQYLNANLS